MLEDTSRTSGRRFAKSGGFRRKASCVDWACMEEIMELATALVNEQHVNDNPTLDLALVKGQHMNVAPTFNLASQVELDDDGYPLIFGQLLQGFTYDMDDNCSQTTADYDDDGFPIVRGDPSHQAEAALLVVGSVPPKEKKKQKRQHLQ